MGEFTFRIFLLFSLTLTYAIILSNGNSINRSNRQIRPVPALRNSTNLTNSSNSTNSNKIENLPKQKEFKNITLDEFLTTFIQDLRNANNEKGRRLLNPLGSVYKMIKRARKLSMGQFNSSTIDVRKILKNLEALMAQRFRERRKYEHQLLTRMLLDNSTAGINSSSPNPLLNCSGSPQISHNNTQITINLCAGGFLQNTPVESQEMSGNDTQTQIDTPEITQDTPKLFLLIKNSTSTSTKSPNITENTTKPSPKFRNLEDSLINLEGKDRIMIPPKENTGRRPPLAKRRKKRIGYKGKPITVTKSRSPGRKKASTTSTTPIPTTTTTLQPITEHSLFLSTPSIGGNDSSEYSTIKDQVPGPQGPNLGSTSSTTPIIYITTGLEDETTSTTTGRPVESSLQRNSLEEIPPLEALTSGNITSTPPTPNTTAPNLPNPPLAPKFTPELIRGRGGLFPLNDNEFDSEFDFPLVAGIKYSDRRSVFDPPQAHQALPTPHPIGFRPSQIDSGLPPPQTTVFPPVTTVFDPNEIKHNVPRYTPQYGGQKPDHLSRINSISNAIDRAKERYGGFKSPHYIFPVKNPPQQPQLQQPGPIYQPQVQPQQPSPQPGPVYNYQSPQEQPQQPEQQPLVQPQQQNAPQNGVGSVTGPQDGYGASPGLAPVQPQGYPQPTGQPLGPESLSSTSTTANPFAGVFRLNPGDYHHYFDPFYSHFDEYDDGPSSPVDNGNEEYPEEVQEEEEEPEGRGDYEYEDFPVLETDPFDNNFDYGESKDNQVKAPEENKKDGKAAVKRETDKDPKDPKNKEGTKEEGFPQNPYDKLLKALLEFAKAKG